MVKQINFFEKKIKGSKILSDENFFVKKDVRGKVISQKRLDFLLVGFCKSGTSSLDAVLRRDGRIVLPKIKETQYISNHKEVNIDYFWNIYYPNYRRNKYVGGVEPTYYSHAKEVNEVFGSDLKLIFMMRNPVKANFSQFKMRLRGQGNSKIDMLYRKYSSKQLPEMYEHYVRKLVKDDESQENDDFLYERWIEDYLRYFELRQMHFILFEDFVADPQAVVNGVMEFLGLIPKKINLATKINADSGISKNWICRMINKSISLCLNRCNNLFLKGVFSNLRNKVYLITLIKNDMPMSKNTEYILRRYYKSTVHYIEQLLQRDLSQTWF